MLFELLTPLDSYNQIFNLFRYITVRAALAGASAFLLSLLLGPILIRRLRAMSIGQSIREEGPESHQKKAGTPTMGGVLIVATVTISTLLWADLSNSFVWIQLFATVGFALVGFIDDRAKVLKNHNLGLSARGKMGWLITVALIASVWMYSLSPDGTFTTELYFPFFKEWHPDLGSLLFEAICQTPEYYIPDVERALLAHHAADIAALIGPDATVLEYGAGALTKIRLLLDAMDAPRRVFLSTLSLTALRMPKGETPM